MTIKIDDTQYTRIGIVKGIEKFCRENYLKFEGGFTSLFSFSIQGVIPRETKGFIDEILNGFYDNETLCNCYVDKDCLLYIKFTKQANDTFIENLLDMNESEGIDMNIQFPCDI